MHMAQTMKEDGAVNTVRGEGEVSVPHEPTSRFSSLRQVAEHPASGAVNRNRRTLIKFIALGGAAFLLGKFLGPLINTLQGDTVIDEKTLGNYKVTETGREVIFSDRSGNAVLIIDKDSF